MNKHTDANNFAEIIKNIKSLDKITIGRFELKASKGVKNSIQYNQSDIDLLDSKHEYTLSLLSGDLQVSLQLYKNERDNYRLFCFTRFKNVQGMTFSINLTTEKESEGIIYLTQKLKFVEQYDGSEELAKAHRRQKQIVFCEFLRKLGMEVTENNELILGIFDPVEKKLINTSPIQFLNDFIVVSILKGHFQGNKGYQLEILPTFNIIEHVYTEKDDSIKSLPKKTVKNK